MKIGFSFGKCIRDIVRGEVKFEDVMVVVANTHMKDFKDVQHVVEQYMNIPNRLMGLDQEACMQVAQDLWFTGRIHQPRAMGMSAVPVSDKYVWMDLIPTATSDNPMVQEAWENYRMALALGGDKAIPSMEGSPAAPFAF